MITFLLLGLASWAYAGLCWNSSNAKEQAPFWALFGVVMMFAAEGMP